MASLPAAATDLNSGAQNAASFDHERDDVFARIADRYDLLCDIFSLMLHRGWKSRMAKKIADQSAGIFLDVASGTGDIPLRVLRRLDASQRNAIVLNVTDICDEMLGIARKKLPEPSEALRFAKLDAEDLRDVTSNSVDLYSISFGMKICDRKRAVAEAFRVLKPGGKFICLEASRIPIEAIHRAYLKYMDWCLPLIGRLAANGDRSAYDYLLSGVHSFPTQREFACELADAGFVDISYENLTFGIVALHEARKPKDS